MPISLEHFKDINNDQYLELKIEKSHGNESSRCFTRSLG